MTNNINPDSYMWRNTADALKQLSDDISKAYADEGMNFDEYIATRKSADERHAVSIVFGLAEELFNDLVCMKEAPRNFYNKR